MGRLFWIVRWPNVITGSLYERDGGEAGGGRSERMCWKV